MINENIKGVKRKRKMMGLFYWFCPCFIPGFCYFRVYYKLDGSHQYVETGVLEMNQWYKVEVEQRLVLDKVSLIMTQTHHM